jgi:hypothetical protein
VVAFARVGAHRLVKLRVDGAGEPITLLMRWVPDGAEWRLAALETVSASAVQPA